MFALRIGRPSPAAPPAGNEALALLHQVVTACGGELVPAGEGVYELYMPEPWDLRVLLEIGRLTVSEAGWTFTISSEWAEMREELLP